MLLMGLSQAMYLPWDIYFTFVLEELYTPREKFGFNKTTVATFIRDRVKAGLLAVLLGIPILAVVLWFLSSFGTGAWLWVWIFVSSVQVLLLFLMPVLLLPLFMEMIPLPDGQAIITEEAGEDGKALPPFLSGRVFYAKNDSAYATRDRRFTGAKVGDGLAVLPFVGGSWVISSGNGEKVETVHATSSEKGTQIAAGTRITFQLSEEKKDKDSTHWMGRATPPREATGPARRRRSGIRRSFGARCSQHGHGGIYVIDGSARSAHSNAFCTGFGSFRRICLFDTLLPLLSEDEILAVLGHEIGHDRMYHVHSMLSWGAVKRSSELAAQDISNMV
eukprot:g31837.t1